MLQTYDKNLIVKYILLIICYNFLLVSSSAYCIGRSEKCYECVERWQRKKNEGFSTQLGSIYSIIKKHSNNNR